MIGDALVDVFMRASAPWSSRRLREWLRDASRPPSDLVVGSDLAVYTGLLIIDNNRIVAAFVIETARPRRSADPFRAPFEPDPDFYGDGDELR